MVGTQRDGERHLEVGREAGPHLRSFAAVTAMTVIVTDVSTAAVGRATVAIARVVRLSECRAGRPVPGAETSLFGQVGAFHAMQQVVLTIVRLAARHAHDGAGNDHERDDYDDGQSC